ncbi:GNAT family N-acetyltransferase [Yinghuangia aomiensis]|uniref:GNAT family N-acetyltransferase n=1 Tax=Yinghuangia aomiensis TaxID=676205 RepID=A0ABP9I593_9ACTN
MVTVGMLTPEDRAVWQRLFDGYNTFYGRTMSAGFFDTAWGRFAADADIHALGARVDGVLVGIVHFLTHPSTTTADLCYLQDLFTAPEARGAGVGRALIAAVADWARARGCDRVYWQTHEDNTAARRLYDAVAEHHGFVVYRLAL